MAHLATLLFLVLPTLIYAGTTPCFAGYEPIFDSGSFTCTPCKPGFFQPGVNLESCYSCPEGHASSAAGSVACEFCYGNSTVPSKVQTACIARNSAENIVNALSGNYENMLYSGSGKNAWHYVQISAKEGSTTELIWSNQAGVTWILKLQPEGDGYNRDMFLVEPDSPYYNNGHTTGQVEWTIEDLDSFEAGNTVLSVTGPWNEPYTRV
ncbi:hypothetical protein BWQ96_07389 [Gracilariopsis chorda]|uniref:Tyrosine-protein kinase ephrin type A/B receptor-like domain-containing protein n=1 Tax=Gracilariopsis chorda TaxID=448386 RepID=A0A2V3ILC0_9FLOR|nr:hypothetical protein BWQ96_07389 [Gracilariopsis chorda]|eukprot:PXF42881.1 hypothetical protein BWQ96_07389 [Gracilariopsis chorda]